MWNRLKLVIAVVAISTAISILFLEVVLLCAGVWRERIAALCEPVNLFADSCDVTQLEEIDVVSSTISVLYGRYDYTHDDSISDTAYYYVLPIDTAEQTYYIGIRETKGRKSQFRKLAMKTVFDAKPTQFLDRNPLQDDAPETSAQDNEIRKPIFVEGFLYQMNEQQYNRFQTWLERAGYFESGKTQQGQILPYYIVERDITKYKKQCVGGLIWTALSIVMLIGSAVVWIRWGKKRKSQTHVTIAGKIYEKEQLAGVNQLIEKLEPMPAIQELSRITGLDMVQAEKIFRHWYDYWY